VLWVQAERGTEGMNVLLAASVKKIAMPYGRPAEAAWNHVGSTTAWRTAWCLGENVSQAAQFAEPGNAQAGFVAVAQAVAPGMRGKGKYWEVLADDFPPLTQGVVVLSHSRHKKGCRGISGIY
jgi:molybdate transport system substrate-binding protein